MNLDIDISEINSDDMTHSDGDNDIDIYVSNLEWTDDLYDVNLLAFFKPNEHTFIVKDSKQVNYLSLF